MLEFKNEEEYKQHMQSLYNRVHDIMGTRKKPEEIEDPWTEEAVRIVGEKIIAKILAKEKGKTEE